MWVAQKSLIRNFGEESEKFIMLQRTYAICQHTKMTIRIRLKVIGPKVRKPKLPPMGGISEKPGTVISVLYLIFFNMEFLTAYFQLLLIFRKLQ